MTAAAMDLFAAGVVGAGAVAALASVWMHRAGARVRRATAALSALWWEASHDGMTGLLNRSGFLRRVTGWVAAPRESLTVAVIDLNGFKPVNDTYGHAAGDLALIAMARHFTAAFGPGAVVGRLHGDEFAVVLPTAGACTRLIAAASPVAVTVADGMTVTVSASIGAVHAITGVGIGTALARADAAMYRAKEHGGGVAHYHPAADDDTTPGRARPAVRTRDLSKVTPTVVTKATRSHPSPVVA